MTSRPLLLRVAIPHFFRESAAGSGYGSGRSGQRLARCMALGRCLHGVLALRRSPADAVLHIGERSLHSWPADADRLQRSAAIELEVHVFTDGAHRLDEALELFAGRIEVHAIELDDPRLLPIACRNWLLHQSGADLSFYLEDDLVITDPLFIDKQLWFLERTNHQAVLMPHRVEPAASGPQAQLLVDGPLAPAFIQRYCTPVSHAAEGRFDLDGPLIQFDLASNPHSGCFMVSEPQRVHLSQLKLPSDGFVSPLETAATLTVLAHFLVFKPSAGQQRFLQIEHGHPSFLGYLNTLPRR